MMGKIELNHEDLIDLLSEARDASFDKKYLEAVIRSAYSEELAYYKELIEDREKELQPKEVDGDRRGTDIINANTVFQGGHKGFRYFIKQLAFPYPGMGMSMNTLDEDAWSCLMEWYCGYVALPEGHKYFGLHYNDIPVEAFRGLTYSKKEGSDWVIGFDTQGAPDQRSLTEEWLREECMRIIDQVAGDE